MACFHGARFYTSVAKYEELPQNALCPEIAFVGRSNVGKSRAMNALVGQKRLVFTSKQPGCTRLLNFFQLPKEVGFLVDMPGYGYAAVAGDVQQSWESLVGDYLLKRSQLVGIVLFSDIRCALHRLDWQLLDWFSITGKPVHIVLTKADQLVYSKQKASFQLVQAALNGSRYSVQLFSSLRMQGTEECRDVLQQWLHIHE